MPWYKQAYDWVERRVQLEGFVKESVEHPVPSKTASWWYVFGSASFVLLLLQIVTGILLALVYVPSAASAWASLQVLNHQLPLGWFLRGMHGWGSNFMVAIVLIHMCQVFLFGAYKFPRELTWILGVFLLLMTLAMAFTGQVLRFDQDSYWGLGIGASILSRVPFIGRQLVEFMLGGPIIAGATLTRFFALHVFVIPATMLAFASLHTWLVLKLGINEWPTPGRLVKRETYIQEYNELSHKDGVPFVPGAVWKDAMFAAGIVLAVAICALLFGPHGTDGCARSDHRADRAQARLFLPVDLYGARVSAAFDRDAGHAHRAGDRRGHHAGAALRCRAWREELASPAGRGDPGGGACRGLCHAHPSRHVRSMEPADGWLERRSGSGALRAREQRRWSGRARLSFRRSNAATAIRWADLAGGAGHRWIMSRRALRKTNWCAR